MNEKYLTQRERNRLHAIEIEEGRKPDDFKNHFLSHFGFHELSNEKDSIWDLEIHKDIYPK